MLAAQPRTAGYRPEQNQTTTDTCSTCLSVGQHDCYLYAASSQISEEGKQDGIIDAQLCVPPYSLNRGHCQTRSEASRPTARTDQIRACKSAPCSPYRGTCARSPGDGAAACQLRCSPGRQATANSRAGQALRSTSRSARTGLRRGSFRRETGSLVCTDVFVRGSRAESHDWISGRCSFHEHGNDGGATTHNLMGIMQWAEVTC